MRTRQIVFLESYATVMIYKISREFKKKGYETVLIRILGSDLSDKQFYDKGFDKVINFNFNFVGLNKRNIPKIIFFFMKSFKHIILAFKEIFKLKPYVFFGRANPNLPVSFFRILFRKIPFIYFPYDIRVHYAPTVEIAKKERGFSILEIKSERFNFEHADGVMTKGSIDSFDYLNGRMLGDNIKLPEFKIHFHPYCSKEFIMPLSKNKLSKKDNEMHIVGLGSVGNRTLEVYQIYFRVAKYLIEQKIHFHLYLSPNILLKKDEQNLFFEKYKDHPNIKYFHIHDSLNPKDIVSEIAKYDFGLTNPDPVDAPKHNLDPNFVIGNRVSTFLEAGIPHFYSYNAKALNNLMADYGLKLPLAMEGSKNIKDIKNRINKLNYKVLEKNILSARKDFLMEKQFPRLEEFVKQVVNKKKGILK